MVKCLVCGEEFQEVKYQKGRMKYCSAKCRQKSWERSHPEQVAKWHKTHYDKNPQLVLSQNNKYYINNKDKILMKAKEDHRIRYSNPDKRKIMLSNNKKWRDKLKLEVLTHYSDGLPKCICCGETNIKFLTIDHINNDGAEHRRKIGKDAGNFYRWLKKNNYPKQFQVMCYNCNCGKRANNGICPHKNKGMFI